MDFGRGDELGSNGFDVWAVRTRRGVAQESITATVRRKAAVIYGEMLNPDPDDVTPELSRNVPPAQYLDIRKAPNFHQVIS
jgi:hypothetical protein